MLRIPVLPVTPFAQNCSVLVCEKSGHAAVIDPGGDAERLFPLGDDIRFVPGHGPMSSFGQQRRSNPFVAEHLFQ